MEKWVGMGKGGAEGENVALLSDTVVCIEKNRHGRDIKTFTHRCINGLWVESNSLGGR